jgi:hypothetical protein
MSHPTRVALTLLFAAGTTAWILAAALLWLILARPLRAIDLVAGLFG